MIAFLEAGGILLWYQHCILRPLYFRLSSISLYDTWRRD
jgi:hypothetical protein